MSPLPRFSGICFGSFLPHLPFAPHLVTEAPILHSVRFVAPCVLATQVRVVAVLMVSTALLSRQLGDEAHVSPVPLQYSIQWSASSSVPVPMLSTMYGSIFAARHTEYWGYNVIMCAVTRTTLHKATPSSCGGQRATVTMPWGSGRLRAHYALLRGERMLPGSSYAIRSATGCSIEGRKR